MQPQVLPIVAACIVAGVLACDDGDASVGEKPLGQLCEISDVRVEHIREYRPPSGRPLPLPTEPKAGYVAGATGTLVKPPIGQPGPTAMRLTATGEITITFLGPHDLTRLESLACVVWPVPRRALEASVLARSGGESWTSAAVGPASEGEGWQLFRVPLPEQAVRSAHADSLALTFSGEAAGEVAVETPVLEWIVPPPWKAVLDGDLAQPRTIQMSDGTRTGFGLAPGRVLRAKAKLAADGGEVVFWHGSIEPARGKPTLAWFGVTVRHPDGRVGQAQQKLETRGKWTRSRVPFQGRAGETVEIEIEFAVEGPATLCTAVTVPEVFAP